MKKLLIYFSFFIIHSSFCFAQDTLVLTNGQKMGVKVIRVTYEVFYSSPPDSEQHFVDIDEVNYIRYKDGSVYIIDHPDTVDFKPAFYLAVSGQFTAPAFNSYAYQGQDNMYEGYAQSGITWSVTGGVNLYRGWGLTAMYSYIPIHYDASYYVNEASGILNSAHFPDDITVNGNYHLTNYAYMLGITKADNYKFGDLGARIMAGKYITYIPAMQGTASSLFGFNNPNAETYSLYSTSATQTNSAFDFGLYGDIKIARHILLHTAVDMLLSKMTVNGNYSLVDITTGQSLSSGAYSNSNVPGYHRADLINIDLGLGYLF